MASGTGSAVLAEIDASINSSTAVVAETAGTGDAIDARITNGLSNATAMAKLLA